MFYRIKDNRLYDYADFKYADDCSYTDIITKNQLDYDKNQVIIENGELKLNENWEDTTEQQRVALLNMTKYDFYKHICLPNGISYNQLMQMVNSNEDIMAAWNLCERIYRGDQVLIAAIHQFLPNISDEQLTQIFEEVQATYGQL